MPPRVRLPVPLSTRPFRTREAETAGLTRERLRSADIAHPFHGINIAGGAPSGIRDRAEAFSPLLRAGDAFSHATAAVLFDAQLPRSHSSDSRLHVTTTGGNDRFRRRGVVGHRSEALPIRMIGAIPVVEPAHVWVQLATMLVHDDLVAVGDRWVTAQGHGRARRPAITSIAALRAAIPSRARGAARARRALADVRVGAESRMETRLRLLLIRAGLPEPLLNPPMLIDGQVLHPDLAYPQWRVVLEYEGEEHRLDPRRWRSDITRRERFEAAGERVIRVHAGDILAEPEAFLARVARILAQRRTPDASGTLDQHPRDGGRLSE